MRSIVFSTLLIFVGVGCSPYVEDYQYAPRPALTEIRANPAQEPPPLAAFVSIIGIRRADSKLGIPESVDVRMRLENNGPQTVVFDPRSLELINGALVRFPPALVRPPEPITLAPRDAVTLEAYFPFPPGHSYEDTDLGSLQLRWQIQIDGHAVQQSAYFHRIYPARYYYGYYGPYWYPYPAFGGVVIIHGHRR